MTYKKENVLVSFSGGRTSAYMAKWMWDNCQPYFNMVFVFANTGLEHFNTLSFVARCEHEFGFKIHLIEADVNPQRGIGTGFVEYDSILDLSEPDKYSTEARVIPFEQMIQKYGLPNQSFKHCTRELKTVPIKKFGQSYFRTNDFYQAIGIRADECDRMSVYADEKKLIYPLIRLKVTQKEVMAFWKAQKFDLELDGYAGNCTMCWKKDIRKLALVWKEHYQYAKYFEVLEQKYANHYVHKPILDEHGNKVPIRMYRGNKTISDIAQMQVTKEEVLAINAEKEESCEVHSECGFDN